MMRFFSFLFAVLFFKRIAEGRKYDLTKDTDLID